MAYPIEDPGVMKRLAFVRLLHQQAVEQSRRPEPLNAFAVLAFHDAVELFLRLAGDHLDAQLADRVDFGAYWAELKAPRSVTLTSKGRMDRLNKVRVAFKHHWAEPGTAAVELARRDTEIFFETNTPLVFAVEFDQISMVDLVTLQSAKEMLAKAVAAAAEHDYMNAVAWTGDAFDWLVDNYGRRKAHPWDDRGPFDFGPAIDASIHSSFHIPFEYSSKQRWLESLEKTLNTYRQAIGAMQASMQVLSLGLDYRKYVKFSKLRPTVYYILLRP